MDRFDAEFLLAMARSLDGRAARRRSDSYMRKLLEEQAARFREAARRR